MSTRSDNQNREPRPGASQSTHETFEEDERTHRERVRKTIYSYPFLTPLLIANEGSDARDNCANERNFLAFTRMSLYLGIVSLAFLTSFHLSHVPNEVERRLAIPVSVVFVILSLSTQALGIFTYFRTLKQYTERRIFVQHGRKTDFLLIFCGIIIALAAIISLVLRAL